MRYEVTAHDLPEEAIVSIRERLPTAELPGFIGRSYETLFSHVGELGLQATEAPFIVYHAFGPGAVDAEVCVPVPHPVAAGDGMTSRLLPAATVARTLHVGAYDGLGAAYTELTEWVGDHGFEAVGPARERYLNQPGPDVAPADYLTEIDIPIAAAKVSAPV